MRGREKPAVKRHGRQRRWRLLAGVALVLAVSIARAEHPQIAYYDVSGNNAQALRRQMNANGPLDHGKRFDAHTDWYVKWNYRYRPTASGCEFTSVDVSVTGTIKLPRWIHADDASSALVKKWDKYLAALRVHEEGHYAHGVSAAKEIEALAKSFHDSGDCLAMTAAFNQQAYATLGKYNALDVAYDRETAHGRTQGAQFP
jgi:predicted secreted Zn-dependent protease